MNTELLIFSPHLDDAALNCSDHIFYFKQKGFNVKINTVFSTHENEKTSKYQQEVISSLGFSSCKDYFESRRKEDSNAMELLDVRYNHMGLVDAGFRLGTNGQPQYTNYKTLTPWKVDDKSQLILENLIKLVKGERKMKYIVPLGVGGHIDHVLTRAAIELTYESDQIAYYVEFPYGLRPWKYRIRMLKDVLNRKLIYLKMSPRKLDIMNCYQSQMPNLFRKKPNYPEIMLIPRQWGL